MEEMSVFIQLALALLGGGLLLPAGLLSVIGGKPPRLVGLLLLAAGSFLVIYYGDPGLVMNAIQELGLA